MEKKRTLGETVSDHVAHFGGSWKFIFSAIFFLALWIIFNIIFDSFDNYPFILLNLILSCIAAFQSPFIMMSQNRTEKKQDEAYRMLLQEIKELVETEIKEEREIFEEMKQIKEMLKLNR